MSARTTPKNARAFLNKGLQDDAELAKDLSALFSFAAVTTGSTPLSLVAALGILLQTSGSIVSAALSLASRFRGPDEQPADTLAPYERFSALFLLTTIRAYMEALDTLVTYEIGQIDTSDGQTGDTEPDSSDNARKELTKEQKHEQRLALEEARLRARDINDADLTYLFGVEPLTDEVPLLKALHDWLYTSLVALGVQSFQARILADKCDESARSCFRSIIAEDNPESTWMRNFLVLESQSAEQASIRDLHATVTTLQGWLIEHQVPSSSHEAWDEYRKVLVGLPDMKATMYSEEFGVSKVFQAPIVQYHVAGARGEAGVPHVIDDVGRLLGALVSTRTEGQDLIVLSGGPGSGKSTLCRVFASELARSVGAYPIFLQLRRAKEGADIAQFVEEALQSRGLVARISELLHLPNVVLVLDGFDELVAANRSRLRQFFNALLDETQTGPLRNAHVIVSGRDTLFPGGQGLPVGSHVVGLLPFDRKRVEAWGSRWREQHSSSPGSTFRPELFLNDSQRGKHPQGAPSPLEHLVTWPLTLHLVARVHTAGGLPAQTESGKRLDKAYLYRSILAETSARQAGQVAGEGRLEPEAMREFLRSVAWLMYTRSVDSLDIADVAPLLETLEAAHSGLDASQLAEVSVLNAPELSKGEETGFEFVHKSFSEFLAAEIIAERVERASFVVPEFGSEAPAWRMSTAEASTALGEVLGIRLLSEEIQEMLEPMLGAVLSFRAGKRVEDTVPWDKRRDGLEDMLRRCESMYALSVDGVFELNRLEEVVKGAPGVTNVLEGLANYLVGLALVGCAAARQIALGSPGRRFNAEPDPGAIWRFLALAHAGGISFDERLAARLFPQMTVSGSAGDKEMADVSVPWKLHLLDEADGYVSQVQPALDRATIGSRATMRLVILLLAMIVEQSPHRDAGYGRHEGRVRYDSRYIWDRMRHESWDDATYQLTVALAQLGVVSPQRVHMGLEPWYDEREFGDIFRYMYDILERSASDELMPAGPKVDWRRMLEPILRDLQPLGRTENMFVELVAETLDLRGLWR